MTRLLLHLYRSGDTVVVFLVLLGMFVITNLHDMPKGLQGFLEVRLTVRNLLAVVGFLTVWRVVFRGFGLYDSAMLGTWRAEAARTVAACAVASLALLSFPLMSGTGAFSYLTVLYFWIGAIVAVLLMRLLVRTLTVSGNSHQVDVIILGSGPRAARLSQAIEAAAGQPYRLMGFVDSPAGEPGAAVSGRLLGTLDLLEPILMQRAVDEVLIALPMRSQYAEIQRAIEICEQAGVRARYLADLFPPTAARRPTGDVSFLAATSSGTKEDDPRLLLKRAVDIVLSTTLLVALAPVMLLAAVAVRLSSPGPILFVQERFGLNKRRFSMYKFRTMGIDAEGQQPLLETRNEAHGPVFKIRADPRVTWVGRFLRRTSIDELPQLVNVLKGEMSLVGPRPLPLRDVNRFTEAALMRRFSVKPGLTCLWQVQGRSEIGFEDWLSLDLHYIDHWSLALDFHILLRTVPAVLSGRGAA